MDVNSFYDRNTDSSANPMNIIDLMNQMGVSDPRLQMIAEFMKRQNPPQTENKPAQEDKGTLKRVIGRYKQLKHENVILMERNEILASAIGACPECWGEDGGCELCNGKGVPGAYVPDTDAFVEYVLPAVRKVRSLRGKERNVPKDSDLSTKAKDKSQHTNINQKEV
jgi:hypothetical protein